MTDMYNLVFDGKVLNKKPLTKFEAYHQRGTNVMNYGYYCTVVLIENK